MRRQPSVPKQALRVLAIAAATAAALAIVLTTSACTAKPPSGPPSIRGTIASIAQTPGGGGSILVEGAKEQDTQYDKASVSVVDDTQIFDADGTPGLSISDLEEGMRVEVWFTGPVAESYPVQARAEAIKVLAPE